MFVYELSVDEMSVDKLWTIFVNKMSVYKMPVGKVSV